MILYDQVLDAQLTIIQNGQHQSSLSFVEDNLSIAYRIFHNSIHRFSSASASTKHSADIRRSRISKRNVQPGPPVVQKTIVFSLCSGIDMPPTDNKNKNYRGEALAVG
jgi:hypothetical protein